MLFEATPVAVVSTMPGSVQAGEVRYVSTPADAICTQRSRLEGGIDSGRPFMKAISVSSASSEVAVAASRACSQVSSISGPADRIAAMLAAESGPYVTRTFTPFRTSELAARLPGARDGS